jgi:hypothetical protein
MSLAELVDVRLNVNQAYVDKMGHFMQRFLDDGPGRDCLLAHMLEPLVRQFEHEDVIPQLSLVCTGMYQMTRQVTHVRILCPRKAARFFTTCQWKRFEKITSLELNGDHFYDYVGDKFCFENLKPESEFLKKITHLCLYIDTDFSIGKDYYEGDEESFDYNIRGEYWESLASLKITGPTRGKFDGLQHIKTLRELDVHLDVLKGSPSSPNTLYKNGKLLTHLCLHDIVQRKGVDIDYTKMPRLTYLESDTIWHFSGFTGRGLYRSRASYATREFKGADLLPRVSKLLRYNMIVLDGQWTGGVFTGQGEIRFLADGYFGYHPTRGQEFLERGEWINGKRHGIHNISVVYYDKKRKKNEKRIKNERVLVTETWCDGTLAQQRNV